MSDSLRLDWVQVPTLQLLSALSHCASLGAAARHTGMAQPNASRAIALLERRIGLRIVERSPKGASLTPDGTLVVAWAEDVLQALERLTIGVQALSGKESPRVIVGASQTVAEYLAPAWLRLLREEHSRVSVTLHMENSEHVVAGVVAGRHDIGFVESPQVPAGLHCLPIREDRLEVVVPPNHSWAARESEGCSLSLEELAATALVVRESGSGTRALLDAALRPYPRVAPVGELSSTSAIIRATRQGLGPAVLSRLAAVEELSSGRLVRVPVDSPKSLIRTLHAVWSGPVRLAGPAGLLLEVALRHR